jgi:hypothetical protein
VLARGYFEWFGGDVRKSARSALFVTDVLLTAGSSHGRVPLSREFVGGNREPLLDGPLTHEDYALNGPVVRGYGTAKFHALNAPAHGPPAFAGISLTIGFLGFSELLFAREMKDPEYRRQFDAVEQDLTDATVARAMSRFLLSEPTIERARERAQAQLSDTKRTLTHFLNHAKSYAFRPTAVFDYARLNLRSSAPREAWSAGLGVRGASGPATISVLYLWNDRRTARGDRDRTLLIRFQRLWDKSDF